MISRTRAPDRRARKSGLEGFQRFGDGLADGHARIEARERILEHDLQFLAQPALVAVADLSQVARHPHDGAAGLGQQRQHGARQRRLAATGFADDAERLALAQREAHAVDGAQRLGLGEQPLAAHREINLQVVDVQQCFRRAAARVARVLRGRIVEARHRIEQHLGVVVLAGGRRCRRPGRLPRFRRGASPARGRRCRRSRPCRG